MKYEWLITAGLAGTGGAGRSRRRARGTACAHRRALRRARRRGSARGARRAAGGARCGRRGRVAPGSEGGRRRDDRRAARARDVISGHGVDSGARAKRRPAQRRGRLAAHVRRRRGCRARHARAAALRRSARRDAGRRRLDRAALATSQPPPAAGTSARARCSRQAPSRCRTRWAGCPTSARSPSARRRRTVTRLKSRSLSAAVAEVSCAEIDSVNRFHIRNGQRLHTPHSTTTF